MIGLPATTPRGRPEDIASLVSYLAKPESRFLTGMLFSSPASRSHRVRTWDGLADINFILAGQTITMDGGELKETSSRLQPVP